MRTDVRNKKDHGQSQPVAKTKDPTLASSRLNLDSNANHLRRQQQQQQQPTSPQSQNSGVQPGATTVVSSSRDQKESRPPSIGIGRSTGGLSPRSLRAMMTNNSSSSITQQGNTARPTTTTSTTTTTTTASSQQSRLSISPKQANGQTTIIGGGAKANAPPSILHRNKHFTPSTNANTNAAATNNHHGQQLPLTPPNTTTTTKTTSYDISPLPVSHNPRVRFMSAGSVASTSEASQVHLMAGAAGSVASSSAMSSADNNRDNVFDRVLHMVMAEEHERLNAMGMSSSVVSSAAAAKKAVVKTTTSSSVNVAATPAPRGLIDVDTGAQIIDKKLELDTSMEVEYHDINDDGIPEERWTKLNDAALASGMQDLAFDSSSPQGSDSSANHATRLRRGNAMKGYPNQQREGNKTKSLDKDLRSNEWVAFDNNTLEGSKRRNEKSDTTRRVNDLASF